MFDSLYDEHGREWQTKAFDNNLDVYHTGDHIPPLRHLGRTVDVTDFQVMILGERRAADAPSTSEFVYSLATVRDGVLVEVDARRDEALPRLDYHGEAVPF